MRHANLTNPGALGVLLLAMGFLAGCGGSSMDSAQSPSSAAPPSAAPPTAAPPPAAMPSAVMQAKDDGTPVNPAIVDADNRFGVSLFQNLTSGAAGNAAISPLSIALALQIVYNGALGATQQAMAGTLQLAGLSTPLDLNMANAALQGSLVSPDPKVQLTVANSLWMHLSDNPVMPSFTQTDQTYYGATVGDLSGAPNNVNAWIAAETNGLITQILPAEPAGYFAMVNAIIANAIYFKGQWSTGFDLGATSPAPFTLSDGTLVSAAMMHRSGHFFYFRGANFQVVRLPYGAGRFSMLIVLPDSSTSLGSLIAGMTAEQLDGWVAQTKNSAVSLGLPKFTATYGHTLPATLTALGMGIAFCSSNEADFSGIAAHSCIDDVEHKTVVEVDESGTVAAGATSIVVGITAVEQAVPMTMDHPFLYAIRDDETGALLFIGALQNPN